MPEIIIKALTSKGREVMSSEGKQSRLGASALRMIGVKEKIIRKEPLTIKVSMRAVPRPVLEQMEIALSLKFEKLGAMRDIDYSLEVRG